MIKIATALAVTLLLCACGGGSGGSSVATNNDLESESLDTSDELFQSGALLRVDIDMDPDDYDILRGEGRSVAQLLSGCAAKFEYSHFTASVTINGERLDDVDIRKKGFFGSLSATRPSFKLNLDALVPGREFYNLEKITLNNNNQDTSNTHQCMSYQMFRDAGLAAPRCNFAKVTVNGEDLGIYSHIESIDRRFLNRNFGDPNGNLYEGQVDGDFGDKSRFNLQLKTNIVENDRSDTALVAQALNASDANLPGLLAQVLDLDEFLTFWAMESITGHWDSATGNANNYFVYKDPADDLFHYIPWGTDGALQLTSGIGSGASPIPYNGPLFRYTEIPSRLYAIPEWREKFHDRVELLLDQLWDEDAFNREAGRIRNLTNTPESELRRVREFFALYPQKIHDSISGKFEQLETRVLDQETVCVEPVVTRIRGSFAGGVGSFEYENKAGESIVVPAVVSTPAEGDTIPGADVSMTLVGAGAEGFRIALLSAPEGAVGELSMSGIDTLLVLIGEDDSGSFGLLGFGGNGTLTFDQPFTLDEPASGRFDAELYLLDELSFQGFGGAP
ncbi:MAG: CotH kinase family protein [Halioglobus sp.]